MKGNDAEAATVKEKIPHDHLFIVTGLSSSNLEKLAQGTWYFRCTIQSGAVMSYELMCRSLLLNVALVILINSIMTHKLRYLKVKYHFVFMLRSKSSALYIKVIFCSFLKDQCLVF